MHVIREARVEDSYLLARVGVDTWRSTYCGLMADDYLANLSYERSEARWRERIADNSCPTFVAENDPHGVVGYANAGPERDGDPIYRGELYALYVLKEFQGAGMGRELVRAVGERFIEGGVNSMIVWVLAANPSRGFYERLGGQMLRSKILDVGGRQLEEVSYGWPKLAKDDETGLLATLPPGSREVPKQ